MCECWDCGMKVDCGKKGKGRTHVCFEDCDDHEGMSTYEGELVVG